MEKRVGDKSNSSEKRRSDIWALVWQTARLPSSSLANGHLACLLDTREIPHGTQTDGHNSCLHWTLRKTSFTPYTKFRQSYRPLRPTPRPQWDVEFLPSFQGISFGLATELGEIVIFLKKCCLISFSEAFLSTADEVCSLSGLYGYCPLKVEKRSGQVKGRQKISKVVLLWFFRRLFCVGLNPHGISAEEGQNDKNRSLLDHTCLFEQENEKKWPYFMTIFKGFLLKAKKTQNVGRENM